MRKRRAFKEHFYPLLVGKNGPGGWEGGVQVALSPSLELAAPHSHFRGQTGFVWKRESMRCVCGHVIPWVFCGRKAHENHHPTLPHACHLQKDLAQCIQFFASFSFLPHIRIRLDRISFKQQGKFIPAVLPGVQWWIQSSPCPLPAVTARQGEASLQSAAKGNSLLRSWAKNEGFL